MLEIKPRTSSSPEGQRPWEKDGIARIQTHGGRELRR